MNNYPKKLILQNGKKVSESVKQYVPLKTKVVWGKHKPFITRKPGKTNVKQSTLKKMSNNSNNPEIRKLYEKQRSYVVNLSRKVNTESFKKHMQYATSSKRFWKFCKPFFSNKTVFFDDTFILVENGEVVSKTEEIATHFNNALKT